MIIAKLRPVGVERIPLAIELIFEHSGINGVYNILREGILFLVIIRGSMLAWTVES